MSAGENALWYAVQRASLTRRQPLQWRTSDGDGTAAAVAAVASNGTVYNLSFFCVHSIHNNNSLLRTRVHLNWRWMEMIPATSRTACACVCVFDAAAVVGRANYHILFCSLVQCAHSFIHWKRRDDHIVIKCVDELRCFVLFLFTTFSLLSLHAPRTRMTNK